MGSNKISTIDLEEPVVEALNTIDTVADQVSTVDNNVNSIKSTVEDTSIKMNDMGNSLTTVNTNVNNLNTRLTDTRASNLDLLNNGTYGLNALKNAIDNVNTTVSTSGDKHYTYGSDVIFDFNPLTSVTIPDRSSLNVGAFFVNGDIWTAKYSGYVKFSFDGTAETIGNSGVYLWQLASIPQISPVYESTSNSSNYSTYNPEQIFTLSKGTVKFATISSSTLSSSFASCVYDSSTKKYTDSKWVWVDAGMMFLPIHYHGSIGAKTYTTASFKVIGTLA